MDAYKIEELLGKGTFGKVYKALDQSNKKIAIKIIDMKPETSLSIHVIREIKALKKLRSKCIIDLNSIVISGTTINLCLEYLPFNLEQLISSDFVFSSELYESIQCQLINAIAFIHSKGMIHRDIKPSHVLLDNEGTLKIIDFGMAREEASQMTNNVTSLYYRAPEILLGDVNYTSKIDSWSTACVLLEIKNRSPVFKGEDEISQCQLILSTFGRPEIEYPWDDLFNVEKYNKTVEFDVLFQNKFENLVDEKTLFIVKEMMHLNKNKRISIENLANLPLFKDNANIRVPIAYTVVD